MAESTPSSVDGADRALVDLLEEIRCGLAGLVDGIGEQAAVIASRDVESIQALLDRRATVIERMVGGSDRIPELLTRSRPDGAARDLVDGIEGLLAQLMEADRAATQAMEHLCAGLQKELQQARAVSSAAQVYQSGSPVPPQARFSDREV